MMARKARDFNSLQEFWDDIKAKGQFQHGKDLSPNLEPLLKDFFQAGALAGVMLTDKGIDLTDELQRMILENAQVQRPTQ